MASNCFGSGPILKAQRWDRKEKKEVFVDMPCVAHRYNNSMGGTHREDQKVNKYRISMRTKKWRWPLFSWGIDVKIQNVWLLFRASHPRWSLLELRRHVVRCLLEINGRAQYNQDVAWPTKDTAVYVTFEGQKLRDQLSENLLLRISEFLFNLVVKFPKKKEL